MQRVTVKTSTIFIAKGAKTRVYRSVQDVPPQLRKELEHSTNGFNSATILIADRRGREEIRRALSGFPSGLRSRLASTLAPNAQSKALPPPISMRLFRYLKRNWAEIILPGAAGLLVWLAFHLR
ncbi:MAG: hypothetical protein JO307_02625 [Bryobacterales bacterium]|nr:hypothetical protein [Bryobacterales bacterium]MBV9396563.1 hypothetical protein [Bryobacterales bacterium]